MKGIVFNLLELFISDEWGDGRDTEVEENTSLMTKEPFVAPGTYPDDDLYALIATATRMFKITKDDFLMKFGRFCIPVFAQKYPVFFEGHVHPKPFLKTMDRVHWEEVAKIYKDADPPHFVYKDTAPDKLTMIYSSKRKLCVFARGLIEGVADYYKCSISYNEISCMLKGDDVCEFELSFATPG